MFSRTLFWGGVKDRDSDDSKGNASVFWLSKY
jgi:hypothetical protein